MNLTEELSLEEAFLLAKVSISRSEHSLAAWHVLIILCLRSELPQTTPSAFLQRVSAWRHRSSEALAIYSWMPRLFG